MSDTNTREASTPTRATSWRNDQARVISDDQIDGAEQTERDEVPPLFAKLAPRPSALGVTYSLI